MLNDWNCATKIGELTTFSGCLQNAPTKILQLIKDQGRDAKYRPEPEDDLEMFLKCLFSRMNPEYFIIYGEKDPGKLLDFWNRVFKAEYWIQMLSFAQKRNYQSLIINLKYILP